MQKPLPSRLKAFLRIGVTLGALTCVGGALVWAQVPARVAALPPRNAPGPGLARPTYDIRAKIEYDLLTLRGAAKVTIPASAGDPLSSAVFFLYANANGVGGADGRRKNLVVDRVTFGGQPVPFKLDGAVLHVGLPAPQSAPFAVQVEYHGVVPRGSDADSGIGGMLGTDVSGLLGGMLGGSLGGGSLGGAGGTAPTQAAHKPDNTDYGLYTYGNGILSLGSFWYPQLAMRENGKWIDAAPEGLGDVAYAVKSDYNVQLDVPPSVSVIGPGQVSRNQSGVSIQAANVRECAIIASEDFIGKTRSVDLGGTPVRVESYVTKGNAGRLDMSLDVASRALQIYARRFGPYEYSTFRVVESPLKGGAGGMEYSGMVGIASNLYGDMGKELGGMMTTLDLPGAGDLLKSLGMDDDGAAGATAPATTPPAAGGGDDDANDITNTVGGILGQQKELLDSLLEETIAHEVGHQWWAIAVGSDSQRHPFVDESLTNWTSMIYFEDRYGKAKAAQMSDLHLKTSFSMGAMLGGGDAPANLPTAAYTNNLQYGAVIYGKGALYYEQLRGIMGDAAFFNGLRTYYARYRDRIAGPLDLQAIMIAQSPAKRGQIQALYQRWIAGAHGQEDIGGANSLGDLLGGMDLGGLLGGGGAGDDQ